jgi:hypothetical protein
MASVAKETIFLEKQDFWRVCSFARFGVNSLAMSD